MPPRNIDANGNIQIRFANGSYIETPARGEIKPTSDYLANIGTSSGAFYKEVELGNLKSWIEKINEFAQPAYAPSERDFWKSFMEMQEMSCKKETESAISFEETMGFNT